MKTLKITALALCLNIPMIQANDDDSLCAGRIGLLTLSATTTGLAAGKTIYDYYNSSEKDRTNNRIAKPAVVALWTAFTLTNAWLAYSDCTQHCSSNK